VWIDDLSGYAGSQRRLAASRLFVPAKLTPMVAVNLIRNASVTTGVDVRVLSSDGSDRLSAGNVVFLVTADSAGPVALGKVVKEIGRLASLPRDADGYVLS
jgi:hypothetical protein